jgi:hypothetical protein
MQKRLVLRMDQKQGSKASKANSESDPDVDYNVLDHAHAVLDHAPPATGSSVSKEEENDEEEDDGVSLSGAELSTGGGGKKKEKSKKSTKHKPKRTKDKQKAIQYEDTNE